MGRHVKYLTALEREQAKRRQCTAYVQSHKGREARSIQNKCAYARWKNKEISPFRSPPEQDISGDVLTMARLPYSILSSASNAEYPDLGLWEEPYALEIPDNFLDPALYEDLFEGPDNNIPRFTANLEAGNVTNHWKILRPYWI
ncbi:hypothetical protein OBBRIDRAFT_807335 [Obba rivulosa]|uniref:Uncharacterized protein n=1 Tax=Obba rivulosa TaxID=1052685 RepID=A0A8E2AJI7_9APHY|nr:hypothetical protein OBBRIDRAFT_807335 [Obba rivulosa]